MSPRILILHLLSQRRAAGATSDDIAHVAGITRRSAYQTIKRMERDCELFPAGPRNRMRFYALASQARVADKELRESVKRDHEANVKRLALERSIRLKAQTAARRAERSQKQQAQTEKARQKATLATPWRLESPTKRNTVKPAPTSAEIPPDFPITYLPHGEDRRFTVDPSHRGEFSRAGIGRYLPEGAEA